MVDFNALGGQAGELIGQNAEQIEAAAEQLGETIKEKYGHEEQVDMAIDKLKDVIPGGEREAVRGLGGRDEPQP